MSEAGRVNVGDRVVALGWDIEMVRKGDIGTVTGTGMRNYTEVYASVTFEADGMTVRATPPVAKLARCTCVGDVGVTKQERWAHADRHAEGLGDRSS